MTIWSRHQKVKTMDNRNQPGKTNEQPRRKCPICRKLVAEDSTTFPFCGERCRTIDLGKWANEDYRISRPIEQADIDEE